MLMTHSPPSSDTDNKDPPVSDSAGNKRHLYASENVHFKILVPSVAAGAVIGKKGDAIAKVQKDTGAKVKMSKSNDYYPGTMERVCLIVGSVDAIMRVHDYIMDKIYEKPEQQQQQLPTGQQSHGGTSDLNASGNESSPPGSNQLWSSSAAAVSNLVASGGPGSTATSTSTSATIGPGGVISMSRMQSVDNSRFPQERHKQVKILAPNSTAGMIIGKGGQFIKEIKEASGAYVQISQKSKDSNVSLPERCVIIAGERENNRNAVRMILQKISDDPQSATCPNISYAEVNGPLPSAYPTGSPYALSTAVGGGVGGGVGGVGPILPNNGPNNLPPGGGGGVVGPFTPSTGSFWTSPGSPYSSKVSGMVGTAPGGGGGGGGGNSNNNKANAQVWPSLVSNEVAAAAGVVGTVIATSAGGGSGGVNDVLTNASQAQGVGLVMSQESRAREYYRSMGYSEGAVNDICNAMQVLAQYGILTPHGLISTTMGGGGGQSTAQTALGQHPHAFGPHAGSFSHLAAASSMPSSLFPTLSVGGGGLGQHHYLATSPSLLSPVGYTAYGTATNSAFSPHMTGAACNNEFAGSYTSHHPLMQPLMIASGSYSGGPADVNHSYSSLFSPTSSFNHTDMELLGRNMYTSQHMQFMDQHSTLFGSPLAHTFSASAASPIVYMPNNISTMPPQQHLHQQQQQQHHQHPALHPPYSPSVFNYSAFSALPLSQANVNPVAYEELSYALASSHLTSGEPLNSTSTTVTQQNSSTALWNSTSSQPPSATLTAGASSVAVSGGSGSAGGGASAGATGGSAGPAGSLDVRNSTALDGDPTIS